MRAVHLPTRLLVLAASVATFGIASAQELALPATPATPAAAPAPPVATPTRGSLMSQVQAQFGAPTERHGAIGNPPITRWDYPGFSVFFEHEHVIHAVLK